MINAGVSKHFTRSYKQYIAYTKDIKYTTINISKSSAIYVKIGISSISSIKFVLNEILIRHIKFHIVNVDAFVLFSLVDMD